ncbi:putative transposase [Acanthamoeba castellanii mamavirus]|nr:putative transposase [Acanthamoeba castellanii mamavirus]
MKEAVKTVKPKVPAKKRIITGSKTKKKVFVKKKQPAKKPPDKKPVKKIVKTDKPKSIYVPNKDLKISKWIPIPKKEFIEIETNSWYEHRKFENPNKSPVQTYNKIVPVVPPESIKQQNLANKRKKTNKSIVFISSEKIRIYPTRDQQKILQTWFRLFAYMYNSSIDYINSKKVVLESGRINVTATRKVCNKISVRKALKTTRDNLIQSTNPSIMTHIMDEAIGLACSNYKTCLTNYIEGQIKKFDIKPWSISKRRKIIVIEPGYFKGNSFCPTVFPKIKSSKPLTMIDKTVTLQYDSDTRKYILFVPRVTPKYSVNKEKNSCGIDPGLRDFLTVYSENETQSICPIETVVNTTNNEYNKIDKINEIIKTKPNLNSKRKKKLNRGLRKYHRRVTNKMKDMHYKVSHELVHTFDKIYIGKLNVKSILSKTNNVLKSTLKRKLATLSFYRFTQRLTHMGYKYGTEVVNVNEYLTTKTCSNCGKIKDLGASKIYKCESCGMYADRDENAAKNILKVGLKPWYKQK